MDVYPLERPREREVNYSKNLRKQHDEMLRLLDDPCPDIRVVAIKVYNYDVTVKMLCIILFHMTIIILLGYLR